MTQKKKQETPISRLYRKAKERAKKYDIPFDIEKEDIKIPEKCPILGIKLVNNIGKGYARQQPDSPTLDKVIPELGYTKGNICVISWRANELKCNGTLTEFEQICEYLKSHNKKK